MRIKKGYIILLLIAIIWYGIHKYHQHQKFKEVEQKTHKIFTLIAKQDISLIQDLLDNNLSQFISFDKIMQFCESLNYQKIKVERYKEKNNTLKIEGKIFENNASLPFTLVLKENNTTKIKQFQVGNNSLTKIDFSFPIVAK